jgi:predicted ATPase
MLEPKPYLREIGLKRDKISDPSKYPFSIPAIRQLEVLRFDPDITFLVGENGTGKSTLLEGVSVALGFNAEGGTKNFSFCTRASHSELHTCLRLVRSYRRPRDSYFLRAESFFNIASEIERLDNEPSLTPPIIGSYGGRSLHEQSHGESFLALMMHRFRGQGLYILDEPEAALSPKKQLLMLRRIRQLVCQDSQFIIATHSPILLAYPNAKIIILDQSGYAPVSYEDTEHYQLMRQFLNDPNGMLKSLFAEGGDSRIGSEFSPGRF